MIEDERESQKNAGRRMDKVVLIKMLTKVHYSPKLLDRAAPAEQASGVSRADELETVEPPKRRAPEEK